MLWVASKTMFNIKILIQEIDLILKNIPGSLCVKANKKNENMSKISG